MKALEEKDIEDYKKAYPGRYLKNIRQSHPKELYIFFEPIHYHVAQVYEREKAEVFCPLLSRLRIEAYWQYQRQAMEAGKGQVIHFSYRLAGTEVLRIHVHGSGRARSGAAYRKW